MELGRAGWWLQSAQGHGIHLEWSAMVQEDAEGLSHLARHEAGHAVLAWWLGYDLRTASIEMSRDRGAFYSTHVVTSKEDELMRVLGGPVAEEMSRRRRPDQHLIVLSSDHPDHENLLRFTRSLAGPRPYTKVQIEYQRRVFLVLRPAWSAVEAIAARLTVSLDGTEKATLSGCELDSILREHKVPQRNSANHDQD